MVWLLWVRLGVVCWFDFVLLVGCVLLVGLGVIGWICSLDLLVGFVGWVGWGCAGWGVCCGWELLWGWLDVLPKSWGLDCVGLVVSGVWAMGLLLWDV